MTPTNEQIAILDAAKSGNSLMVEAMAGTGKTSTICMLAKVLPVRPSLALAFNVKIRDELKKKLPAHFEVLTLNSLGHRAWSRALGRRCIVKTTKLGDTIKEIIKEHSLPRDSWSPLYSLVRAARHAGLIPDPISQQFRGIIPDEWESWEGLADGVYVDLSDELVFGARQVLLSLIRKSFLGEIDYDDQIYCSGLFGGVFPRFAEVLIDEAQDLSPLNHQQVKKSSTDRLIVVGDSRQAIYAFRGADSSSMESLRGLRESWKTLSLSTTFRCPRSVVARQQTHAPGFNAHESAPLGEIRTLSDSWSPDGNMPASDKFLAILCRNNAPIIAAALRIIRNGQGCTVLGKEIGKGLIALSSKILPNDNAPAETCAKAIIEWSTKEISLAKANKKGERVSMITDKAECLLAVIDSGRALTARGIRDTLSTMFARENNRITLSTGHKAKGLEFDTVISLDPWRIPSKYALKAEEEGNPIPIQQDRNLNYVIETRTKNTLILANLEGMTC